MHTGAGRNSIIVNTKIWRENDMKNFQKLLMVSCMISSAVLYSCGKIGTYSTRPTQLAVGTIVHDRTRPEPDLHPLFSKTLGQTVPSYLMGSYTDSTGRTIITDWDGDGIPNEQEAALGGNPYTTDYPRITVRTSHPIIMEIEYKSTGQTKIYSETISEENTRITKSKNMDETHYAKVNEKTTPYVVKESDSAGGSNANSYGYNFSDELSTNSSFNFGVMQLYSMGAAAGFTQKTTRSENWSFSNSFNRSSMSERTVFDDVNFVDNMDGSGIELKDTKVMEMENKYRRSEISSDEISYGPDAGIVRTAMYFKNESGDIPVKISHVQCTLLLKLPSGKLDALATFPLQFEDGRPFEVEIGGGDETTPFAVVVDSLNTEKIRLALRNGYIPVISTFSYDMTLVDDSCYQPGIDNLTQVEEGAKGRTAVVRTVSPNRRDIYRVASFDVDENGEMTPGISLKKALFNIFRSPLKGGENWVHDAKNRDLTVQKEGLWWHEAYAGDTTEDGHEYRYSSNVDGNEWDYFATEVKTYTDEFNNLRRIETIKRIGNDRDVFGNYINQKYNPFNKSDNTNYDENEPLSSDELLKSKYWVILHNGKFYEGDINDPIWAGDRYEIVLFNIQDFMEHFDLFVYTPLQSGELMRFDTRWNALVDSGEELARSVSLGTVYKGDVVKLDVYLKESRFLFDGTVDERSGGGVPRPIEPGAETSPQAWWDFRYTTEPTEAEPNGIPASFSHKAEGSVNSLKVHIDDSRYARYYIIKITERRPLNNISRMVKVSARDLKKFANDTYLNSKTIDVNGIPLGLITASDFSVDVFARGVNYDVDVETPSNTNGSIESRADVYDATNSAPSKNFNFSVMSLYKNTLHVRISEIPNAEYFLIRCYGPLNPVYNSVNTHFKQVRGHCGLNMIELDHPYNGLDEAPEPGVYEVKIYSVNKNCYRGIDEIEEVIANTESNMGSVYVNVEYDQYRFQRVMTPFKWVPESERDTNPAAYTRSFGLNAVDLEVNFNEGSGWWRLKLANDDLGKEGREIDCRFSSIVENHRGQHFVIYFAPPAGQANPFHNVFRSSDDQVDLYIRTVAENRYRDTFWMKNINIDPGYRDDVNCIVTGPLESDFKEYWNRLDETDASRFEETVAKRRIDSPSEFAASPMGLFEKVRSGTAYFFSPMEQRKYLVSAIIEQPDKLVETPPAKLDLPAFKVAPGSGCIHISKIESRYAEFFEVWWKKFDREAAYQHPLTLDAVKWDGANSAPLAADRYNWDVGQVYAENDSSFNYVIPNCEPHQYYVVAVVGKSTPLNGTSDAKFAFDRNGSGDNIRFIMPYPKEAPREQPYMALGVNKRAIIVKLNSESNQCRYVIQWRERDKTDYPWSSIDTYDGSNESLAWNGVTYEIRNLNPRTVYTVKACAATLNNLYGPEASMDIETGVEGGIEWKINWDRPITEYIWEEDKLSRCLDASIFITVGELPVGTSYYTIQGTIECNLRSPTINYHNIYLLLLNLSVETHEFDERVPWDQTKTTLYAFTPVKVRLGIFTIMYYNNFMVRGTIKAYNVNNVEITPRDPVTGRFQDELSWQFEKCPQPPEKPK
ncbi:MAG: hypothetical protein A2176_00540 [Spirochaetes bacterium RBG_13_51_14]|nr:MAG: hypothetical protein A2176_00540 [Spirochaetes bacterium RBG_13_51_14]